MSRCQSFFHLQSIMSIFGETAYTHSDWGVVKGVKKEKGVATSPTTPYNP